MLAAAPNVFLALILTGWACFKRRVRMHLALLGAWAGFMLVIAAYHFSLMSGLSGMLWSRGIWFTENDVLHAGMILWVSYIALVLPRRIEDLRDTER